MARLAILLAGAALAACAAGAQGTAAPDRAADEAAIAGIKQSDWPGFYRQQDVDGLGGFLADGFVNIAPDGTVTERAAELDRVAREAWNPANFRYRVLRYHWLDADRVLVLGEGTSDRVTPDGEPCRHRYASSNLLERAPDAPLGWQARYSHVSGVECVPGDG